MIGVPLAIKQYIEQRKGVYWIANKRVSLDSIVYDFLNGTSPEEIARHFPLVTLEEVYGAIAFYLANREAIDLYLQEGEKQFEVLQKSLRERDLVFYQRLKKAGL
ncbi:DUF433 domain-containing protein [Spirulina sp. 06S082]|uniref:DUF433 domain-containing protein n=1 Tax=Spirulina sp. 06S082 TaxID=3110248 RepID=UPI002B2003C0|nr:DUF433 domain-containing protein [Spirulina sp. 06S082]MEA5468361.1 DUF433 domain-containing protein [Spirulina sp. 06S082]